MNKRGSNRNSCMVGVGSHNSLAGSLGKLVLYRFTGNLGDSMAMFHLNRDLNNLRVVHAVLSGDLTASVFHGGSYRVGDNVSHGGDNGSSGDVVSGVRGISTKVLRVSLSVGFSLSLDMVISSYRSSITKSINNLLADLLILD